MILHQLLKVNMHPLGIENSLSLSNRPFSKLKTPKQLISIKFANMISSITNRFISPKDKQS